MAGRACTNRPRLCPGDEADACGLTWRGPLIPCEGNHISCGFATALLVRGKPQPHGEAPTRVRWTALRVGTPRVYHHVMLQLVFISGTLGTHLGAPDGWGAGALTCCTVHTRGGAYGMCRIESTFNQLHLIRTPHLG